MSLKLRDFIRQIRSCKTAAEERAVIAKECALIRTAFKEGDAGYRERNLAKLLFIHMMGYPTHFAQLECIKLIASPRFPDKRIGYLGLIQVLDENTEILMLVTNSIKNDLHHPSQYVIGLALCALGNIGSPEMCRALAKEVEDLCRGGTNPYVAKKALLCAIRLVRKVDEMGERFIPIVASVLEDKNHGVLLCCCSLMEALIDSDPKSALPPLRKLIPQVVQCLKRVMLTSTYSSSAEYEIAGVTDPFLQVKLLRTLRRLQEGLPEPSEDLSDVLSQIASTTESTKVAGIAVLMESTATIMAIHPDASLKSLGVGVLGKFLQSKESNIRYVAFSSLQQLVKIDPSAVQKHHTIITEVLKDADTSLRRRALEVLFRLVNEDTIKVLFKELLGLLVGGDSNRPMNAVSRENQEFHRELVSKICKAIDLFSPSRRWQVDSIIRVLSLAGDDVPVDVRNSFIFLLSVTPELQSYSVLKLFFAAEENPNQEFLKQVTVWVLGEYGDLLVAGKEAGPDGLPIHVSSSDVMDFLESYRKAVVRKPASGLPVSPTQRGQVQVSQTSGLLIGGNSLLENTSSSPNPSLELLTTCLIKLSTRFPNEKARIERMLNHFEHSDSIELQQRSCEYIELLRSVWDAKRSGILDRMLVPNDTLRETLAQRPIGDRSVDEVLPLNGVNSVASRSHKTTDLLDLNDLLDVHHENSTTLLNLTAATTADTVITGMALPTDPHPMGHSHTSDPVIVTTSSSVAANVEDLLADLFGSSSSSPPSSPVGTAAPTSSTAAFPSIDPTAGLIEEKDFLI